MLNLFRRLAKRPTKSYSIVARYRTGDWISRFTVEAFTACEACRKFDQAAKFNDWIRVSTSTLES